MADMLDRVDERALGIVGGAVGAAYLFATKDSTRNGYSREFAAVAGSSVIGFGLWYSQLVDSKPLIVGLSAFGGVLGGSTFEFYLNKIEDTLGW